MTPEALDLWIKAIQGVGFPVIVAVFVLWRLDTSMRALTKEVHELTTFLRSK
jgi:hypothetical protein